MNQHGGKKKSNSSDDKTGTSLSRDTMFHILRNQRRRYILHYLKKEPQPVEVSSIATQVAAWENEVSPKELTSEQRRRVYNAINQTHLSTLADAGIIQINGNSVELTEHAKKIDIYLEYVPEDDVPWADYYITLTGIQSVLVAATWIGLGPLEAVPPIFTAAIFSVALLVSSIVYYRDQNRTRMGNKEAPYEVRQEG